MKKIHLLILCTFLFFAGCGGPLSAQPSQTALPTLTEAGPEIFPSETAALTATPNAPTAEPSPTTTPEPTVTTAPSPTRYVAFTANVWAANVNLRSNPGYLFPSLRQLEEGAEFTVLGKAPGGDWLYVQRPDNITGWVYTLFVQSDHDLKQIPVVEPEDVQTITGRVLTETGQPINGLQFAITQGTGAAAPRNDATTDENGIFTAFMPLDASGEWAVSYAAISCTSIVHDSSCNVKPGFAGSVQPGLQTVTLPFSGQLEFVWK